MNRERPFVGGFANGGFGRGVKEDAIQAMVMSLAGDHNFSYIDRAEREHQKRKEKIYGYRLALTKWDARALI